MQCGKEINDKDNHCQYCGALQDPGFSESISQPPKEKKHNDHIVPIVAVCSVILIILIVIANLTIFNNGYRKPIDCYFDAIESGDIDDIEDALPDYFIDSDYYDEDKIEKSLQLLSTGISFLDNYDFDISYKELEKKEIDSDELKKLEKKIKKQFKEDVDIDKGYEVKVNLVMELGKIEETKELVINVNKIDGDWCIDPFETNLF